MTGLLLIFSSLYLSFYFKKNSSQQLIIATAERELGKSYLYNTGFSRREPIVDSTPISNLDSVETMETGEVRISFLNGYVVKIFPNSMVTVEFHSENQETTITLGRGRMRVETIGRDSQFFIAKDGRKIPANEFNSQLNQDGNVEANAENGSMEPIVSGGNGELSEDEISTVLKKQNNQFFKCYTQLLQKKPDSKGVATLNFTVERSGKVTDIKIQSNELAQPEFLSCLTETLKRIDFRSFSGNTVSAVFPIRFE